MISLATCMTVLLAMAWLPLAGAVLYLCLLTVAAARIRRTPPPATTHRRTFRLVVPSHNEEQVLEPVLRHMRRLDYPRDRYDIVVIADNCSDATAAVARASGVRVLERIAPHLRGKGHALAFAVEALRSERFDAYIILDADTLVEPDLLTIMNRYLEAGHRVIQAHHDVLNPYDSHRTALMYIAFRLFHYVRPLGRTALHLSTGLNGNGMCFAKPVLEEHSWNAFSLVEDMEYTTMLLRHGECIAFAPEARIRAQMASGRAQATSQRMRWEGGRLKMAWRTGPALIVEGLFRTNRRLIDWGIDLIIPPLAAIVLMVLAGLALATGLVLLSIPFAGWLLGAWLGLAAALIAFVLTAMVVGHLPWKAYRALLSVPWYITWKLGIYILIGLGRVPQRWVRTERSHINV